MNQMIEGTSEVERLVIGVWEALLQAFRLSNFQTHVNQPSHCQFKFLDYRPLDAAWLSRVLLGVVWIDCIIYEEAINAAD